MKSFALSLFADYFQFYIQDEAVAGDLSEAWTEEATARLLAIAPGTIGIGTVRNMEVPVLVEIHDQEPRDDSSEWDHAIEASLDVESGRIVIAGCADYFPDAKRIGVAPRCYRARVPYGALNTLSDDGLTGEDHYRVQLWPSAATAIRVLKLR
jgi:nucleoside phosphorylase